MDTSFIENLGEEVVGPVQRDEAILLFALTRVTRPRVVVEFGYGWGASATAFLSGLTQDAELYSVDIDVKVLPIHAGEARFHFVNKDLRHLTAADIDNRIVDLIFFDAAHDSLEAKTVVHDSIAANLSPHALVVIHDTGLWNKQFMGPLTDAITGGIWITPKLYAHQPSEREFANWLVDKRNYQRIDLFSTRCLRHGLSILQIPQ